MKKVVFLLLAVLMISTVFLGCDHKHHNKPIEPINPLLPEVNPEYLGPANPPQEEILRIFLLKEDGSELNDTNEIEFNIVTGIKAIVKNHKNEVIDVDIQKFKFEIIDKKEAVFTFPNDETNLNSEIYTTGNFFMITGKKNVSGVMLKVTHPKVLYAKKQMFNIKKTENMWDSVYEGKGESLNDQNEGYICETAIFKFKDNKYELYEKQFIKRKYKGKDIKILVKDGSVRGYFEIKGSKLILDNKYLFEITKSGTDIKLALGIFTYQINQTKGKPIFN